MDYEICGKFALIAVVMMWLSSNYKYVDVTAFVFIRQNKGRDNKGGRLVANFELH